MVLFYWYYGGEKESLKDKQHIQVREKSIKGRARSNSAFFLQASLSNRQILKLSRPVG